MKLEDLIPNNYSFLSSDCGSTTWGYSVWTNREGVLTLDEFDSVKWNKPGNLLDALTLSRNLNAKYRFIQAIFEFTTINTGFSAVDSTETIGAFKIPLIANGVECKYVTTSILYRQLFLGNKPPDSPSKKALTQEVISKLYPQIQPIKGKKWAYEHTCDAVALGVSYLKRNGVDIQIPDVGLTYKPPRPNSIRFEKPFNGNGNN